MWEDVAEEDQMIWTCCKEIGSEKGYKIGMHKTRNGEDGGSDSSESDTEDKEEEVGDGSEGWNNSS